MKTIAVNLALSYFKALAKVQLKKYAPDIVGVTGSIGKTTTRNAIAAVLSTKYVTKVSEKANSESGIPLNILGLTPHDYSVFDWLRLGVQAPLQLAGHWQPHEKYVVEMGIDSYKPPKNMEYLLTIVKPRTGVFLNAHAVHSEAFDDLVPETDPHNRADRIRSVIAAEKGKLISSLPENGLAILNADDPFVIPFAKKTKAQVMTFGRSKDNDIVINSIVRSDTSTTFSFSARRSPLTVTLPYLLADTFATSLAAAICIGIDEAMPFTQIRQALEQSFTLEPGRMSLFEGVNGTRIIDSSYNASPEPTIEALKMLSSLSCQRKIALLGDMRELGAEAQPEHERVMEVAMKTMDELVLVGPLMHQYALPFLAKHHYQPVAWFDTAAKAAMYLKSSVKSGDCILVKGSQNTIYLEVAVEALLKHKSDADKLCRRGEFWNQQRRMYA